MQNSPEQAKAPKFLYVTAFSGQVLKVPLKDYIDQAYIMQHLLNAGVSVKTLEHLTFSTVEPNQRAVMRSSFPNRYQVESRLSSPFPPFPKPKTALTWPSVWSNVQVRSYTPLIQMRASGAPFCMIRSDGARVNLWSYPDTEFKHRQQWAEIADGNVGLLYGVAWKQRNVHTLLEGMTYKQRLAVTHGMQETTQYSISATLGASGFGLSASLSATFGQSFEITESEVLTETIEVKGQPNKTSVICIWQLTDLFYIVKKRQNGSYDFIDHYVLNIERPGKYDVQYHADPLFFGNNEQSDDGRRIMTTLVHATETTQMDVTEFHSSIRDTSRTGSAT